MSDGPWELKASTPARTAGAPYLEGLAVFGPSPGGTPGVHNLSLEVNAKALRQDLGSIPVPDDALHLSYKADASLPLPATSPPPPYVEQPSMAQYLLPENTCPPYFDIEGEYAPSQSSRIL
ncbi:MAG: hypothetical protein M1819_003783 [Sarea resinae]|nr:MAG: hypothetical protein M1819_003783 [Sarea resinae]